MTCCLNRTVSVKGHGSKSGGRGSESSGHVSGARLLASHADSVVVHGHIHVSGDDCLIHASVNFVLLIVLFVFEDSTDAALSVIALTLVSALGIKLALLFLGSELQVSSIHGVVEELIELLDGFLDHRSILLVIFVTGDNIADFL